MKFKISVLIVTYLIFTSIPAAAKIITVPNDSCNIQDSINVASNGDTVLVYEGTYTERIDFSGKAILLTSRILDQTDTTNIINSTIIDGDPSGLESPDTITYLSVVRFINGEGSASIIQGFSIENGIGTDNHPERAGRYGGGICCHSSSPTIQYNTIKSNCAVWGGGIGCIYSAPVIQYNTLTADSAQTFGSVKGMGGAIYGFGSAPKIADNNITGNYSSSTGGGIHLGEKPTGLGSCPSITDNMIIDNTAVSAGGGVDYQSCGELCGDFSQNTISGNDGGNEGGAIRLNWSAPTIIGNTIAGNSAQQRGAAIFVEDCDTGEVVIENNTIDSNTDSDAIVNASSGRFTLINNIISNNSGFGFCGGADTMTFNDFWGNDSGPTCSEIPGFGETDWGTNFNGTPCDSFYNIFQDPMFADTISYALVCSSLCVEAGDPTYEPPDSSGCRVDMGAHEFLYPPCTTCAFIYGDVDSSGAVNGVDVLYLHNYVFRSGPAPRPWASGDVNWDEAVNVVDVLYLYNYVYEGGRMPCRQACP